MTNSQNIPAGLQALLDEHHSWPTSYTFRFIVKHQDMAHVLALVPDQAPVITPSSKGSYLSVTWAIEMQSSDAVLSIYKSASLIPGILAL